MNLLWRTFVATARRAPGKRILRALPGGRWIRFADLLARAERLAGSLGRAGVGRAEVVLVAAGNLPAFVEAVLAAWALDAVVLPAAEDLPEAEISALRRTFRPAAEITAPAGRPVIAAGRPGPRRVEGAAMIRLTSGTTGAPRGAAMSAGQLLEGARALTARVGVGPDDTNVGVAPLNHAYGFDHLILPLVTRGTRFLLLRRALPGLVLRALRSHPRSILAGVPYLLDLLARHPGSARGAAGLRLCLSAGAPLPASTAARFRERFGVPVRNFYGTSETGGIAYDDSPEGDAPEGCVGAPLPGVRVTIDRSGLAALPRGQGRVVVEGPAVGMGYVPGGSAAFADGRFRTTDVGLLDREGRVHLAGRVSSLVNVSGRKVNPSEVERALRGLPGVEDAAALGLRDPLRGERLEAWIVAGDGERAASIREALAARLAPHKIPRAIHVVGRIPRTPRGKIDRARLERMG